MRQTVAVRQVGVVGVLCTIEFVREERAYPRRCKNGDCLANSKERRKAH